MPKAVWVSNSLNTEIKEVPIWEPADDEILIKSKMDGFHNRGDTLTNFASRCGRGIEPKRL